MPSIRFTWLIIATLLTGTVAPQGVAAEPAYAIQVTKAKTVRATYAFEILAPKFTAKEWILFAAEAPDLPGQRGVRTRLIPSGESYTDLSDRHRELLRARIPVKSESQKHDVSGKIEWQATLYGRKLVRRQAGTKYTTPSSLSTAERTASLAETKTLDFSSPDFQDWLNEHKLRRRRNEDDVEFGRRAFLAVTRSMKYDYALKMDRRASHLCGDESADCGGMSVLFVAAMRANQIPARVLLGAWTRRTVDGTIQRAGRLPSPDRRRSDE